MFQLCVRDGGDICTGNIIAASSGLGGSSYVPFTMLA